MAGLFFDDYDTPVFRPPSEADSFILRVTRGCAHNSCTYCNMYRGVKFEKLSDEQIMRQIAIAYSVDRDAYAGCSWLTAMPWCFLRKDFSRF